MVESPEPLPELTTTSPEDSKTPKSPVGLVYGGTTSSYQDAVNQRKRLDAERRRATSDSLFEQTRTSPGNAHMYSNSLQGNAYAILEFCDREGHVIDYLECDVSFEPDPTRASGVHLSLCIPCPICVMDRGMLVSDSIMLLQQRNRNFVLDPKTQGELWVNPNDPGASRIRAGMVTSEPFKCQNGCNTRWVIDKDRLRRI